jgi:tetratricopeptide (TPR) repeat protein
MSRLSDRAPDLAELRGRAAVDFRGAAPVLAEELLQVSQRLRVTGKPDEALLPAQEAVRLARRLRDEDESFGIGLAYALLSLGLCLAEAAAYTEAPYVLRECIELTEHLGPNAGQGVLVNHRDTALLLRSNAFECLSLVLGATEQTADAVRAAERALEGYRRLSEDSRAAPNLARGMHNLGTILAAGGRRQEASSALEESLSLYHDLSHVSHPEVAPELSRSQQLYDLLREGAAEGAAADEVTGDALLAYQRAVEADPYSATPGLRDLAANVQITLVDSTDTDPEREPGPEGAREVQQMGRIDLTEAVQAVRTQLQAATQAHAGDALRFEMAEIELEFTVELTKDAGAKAGVRVWVVTDEAEAKPRPGTHRVRMMLNPRQADRHDDVEVW